MIAPLLEPLRLTTTTMILSSGMPLLLGAGAVVAASDPLGFQDGCYHPCRVEFNPLPEATGSAARWGAQGLVLLLGNDYLGMVERCRWLTDPETSLPVLEGTVPPLYSVGEAAFREGDRLRRFLETLRAEERARARLRPRVARNPLSVNAGVTQTPASPPATAPSGAPPAQATPGLRERKVALLRRADTAQAIEIRHAATHAVLDLLEPELAPPPTPPVPALGPATRLPSVFTTTSARKP